MSGELASAATGSKDARSRNLYTAFFTIFKHIHVVYKYIKDQFINHHDKLTYDFNPRDHFGPAVPVLGDAHVVAALVPRDALVEEEEVVGRHDVAAVHLPRVARLLKKVHLSS